MADEDSSPTAAGATNDNSSSDNQVVEGRDYFWEGPFMVFTAQYLQRRGYCCESGCRHCPYQYQSEITNTGG